MGRPSKYSPEFREEAVRLYREGDQSITSTARRLGLLSRVKLLGRLVMRA